MQKDNHIYSKLFNSEGHFTEEGLSLYAEALQYRCLAKLPEAMLKHADECMDCKMEGLEISEILREDEQSLPAEEDHPFFGNQQKKLENQFENSLDNQKKGRYFGPLFRKLAASILILVAVSVAILLVVRKNTKLYQQPLVNTKIEYGIDTMKKKYNRPEVLPKKKQTPDEKPVKKIPENNDQKKSYSVKKDILAEAFVQNSDLDRLLVGETRSFDFNVVLPVPNAKFRNSRDVVFQWKTRINEPLTIKIMDNLGKLKLKETIEGTSYKINGEFRSGLYYWFIGTDEDMLAGGRLEIRNQQKTNK